MGSRHELLYTEVLIPPRRHRDRLRRTTPEAPELEGVTIRPARPADASQAAHLMYLCAPALALTIFGGGRANVVRIFRELFPIPTHMYSHSHTFVAEREAGIVGLLLGLDRNTWEAARCAMTREIRSEWLRIVGLAHLPRMILAALDLARAFDPPSDKNYLIQMLAVLPEMRRQRIGTELMDFASHQARSKGLTRLVLDVLIENEGARRFYEQLGFQAIRMVRDPRFCRRFGVEGSLRMAKLIA